jgi:hypothetical protein
VLRFHFPLIEPDWQFSRIRLSDKDYRYYYSRFRPRKTARLFLKLDQPQLLIQDFIREP